MSDDDFNLGLGVLIVLTVIAVGLYLIPWFTLGAVLGVVGTVALLVSRIT